MSGYLLMVLPPAALLTGSVVGARKLGLARQELGLEPPTTRQTIAALILFVALSALTELLYRRWGLEPTGQPWHVSYSTTALLVRVAFVGLVYPVAEEVFFRGFVFGALRRRFGEFVAIAGSSGLFAVLHLQYDLRGMVLVLIDAIFFAIVRSRTNSVLLTIALHVFGNGYAVWQRF